ncbi:hypothetical protein [Streptomyces sp. SID5910]|uniref:hypothetical protein n=1 Tax=Streptomyces sp. SID5910 TaxID=2690312 RepID=UPI0013702D0C|nr:hypothetical protein [Streptomyces sp. SID5910]MYR44563.1 hypothetical protein [Streptomyces sp. SID5910]
MSKEHESAKRSEDRGPSRHQGSEHHGWSPDVDETHRQDNPSARRSFHPEEHAGPAGPGRKRAREESEPVPGDVARSDAQRGEEYGGKPEKGMRDTERRGRSGRPSGTKDDSAFTGVDPDGPGEERRPG